MKKPSYTFGDTMKHGGHHMAIDTIKFTKGKHDEEPRLFYGSNGYFVEDKYLEDAPEKDSADAVEVKKEPLNHDPDGTLPEPPEFMPAEETSEELNADPDGTVGDEGEEESEEESDKPAKKTASKKKK